jgi:hypothetical protein
LFGLFKLMPESNADKLTAVLKGEARYGIELDSALKTIGETFPATVCLKWFSSIDDSLPSFRSDVLQILEVARRTERLYAFGYGSETDAPRQQEEFTTARRIRFSSSDAAYYQFHLFPPDTLTTSQRAHASETAIRRSCFSLFVPASAWTILLKCVAAIRTL